MLRTEARSVYRMCRIKLEGGLIKTHRFVVRQRFPGIKGGMSLKATIISLVNINMNPESSCQKKT